MMFYLDRQVRKYSFFSSGAIDAVRLLYKYGANQLHADKDYLTGKYLLKIYGRISVSFHSALHCAATRGYTTCIQMLVEQCGCAIEGLVEILGIFFCSFLS